MNARYIKLHTISNPFVSGGGNTLPTNIANTLTESTDDNVFVPSISLLKEYVQNASLGNLFSNGTQLSFFGTSTQGEVGVDVIGPSGPMNSKMSMNTQFDSLVFDPTDFHLSTLSGKLNIQSNAIKYVSVDDKIQTTTERVDGINFVSNSQVQITDEIAHNKHNIQFHVLQSNTSNEMFKLDTDTTFLTQYPEISSYPFIWGESIQALNIQVDTIKNSYIFTGTQTNRVNVSIQCVYQWINADLPYRFRFDMYTVHEGQTNPVFSEQIGFSDVFHSIHAYTKSIILQLRPNEEIYFNIKFDNPFSLKIYESSYLYMEYID